MHLPAAAGRGALDQWQITAAGGLDPSLLVVIVVTALVAVVFTWRSLDPGLGLARRMGITGMRALALGVALAILVQPTLSERTVREVKDRVAIMVDTSGSMTRGGGSSRLAAAKRVLAAAGNELARMGGKHRIEWYGFADGLSAASGPDGIGRAPGEAGGTDVRGALTRLAASKGDEPLAGVILLGDGADTELARSASGELDLSWLKGFGAPVNTVAMTVSPAGQKDLYIVEARAAPFAFSRSQTPIVVTLRSRGLADRKAEVILSEDGAVLQRREVRLVGGEGRTTFSVSPPRLGREVLTVSAPPPPEDQVPENNRAHVTFEVLRDKFRILHLAGLPSWDQRFLRDTLKGWPRVDLVSFYILRTAYQSSTLGSAGLSLIPFPTEAIFEEHLDEFDVIVFQDFEPLPYGVDKYLGRVAEFVRRGGAVAVVGGPRAFGPSGAGGGPLADVLPLRPYPASVPERQLFDATPFRARLTAAGRRHPVTRLVPDEEENKALWRGLTRLDGAARTAGVASGALVLADHPFVQASDGPQPIVAVRTVGNGRSLAVATDSLWRYRFTGPMEGGPPDVLQSFWRKAIAWLTADPELERLRVHVTPSPVRAHGKARFDVEMLDEAYGPLPGATLSATVSWIDAHDKEQTDAFELRLDGEGRYGREWTPRAAGPHRLTVKGPGGAEVAVRFLVEESDKELLHLAPDEPLLAAISDATGGSHFSGAIAFDDLKLNGPARKEVLGRRDVPIWDHPLAILLLVALLAGEWALRRRAGLR
jgi:hypothetical protein